MPLENTPIAAIDHSADGGAESAASMLCGSKNNSGSVPAALV